MPQEISDGQRPVETNTSQTLSNQIFASPKEFLQVLKDDFKDIAPKGQDMIDLADLARYAQHGKDEKGRAAALIAAAHFGELYPMPDGDSLLAGYEGTVVMKYADLDRDLEIAGGNSKSIARNITKGDIELLAITGLSTVAFGALTVGALPYVPLTAFAGSLTAAMAAWAVQSGYNLTREHERAQQIMQQDIQNMNSWIKPQN